MATRGRSTITATVRDATGDLVANQTVDSALTQDPTGGTSATTDSGGTDARCASPN